MTKSNKEIIAVLSPIPALFLSISAAVFCNHLYTSIGTEAGTFIDFIAIMSCASLFSLTSFYIWVTVVWVLKYWSK